MDQKIGVAVSGSSFKFQPNRNNVRCLISSLNLCESAAHLELFQFNPRPLLTLSREFHLIRLFSCCRLPSGVWVLGVCHCVSSNKASVQDVEI
jgi:hypothetical protein